jgi:hypothetical protein
MLSPSASSIIPTYAKDHYLKICEIPDSSLTALYDFYKVSESKSEIDSIQEPLFIVTFKI